MQQKNNRAILVHVDFPIYSGINEDIGEFKELATSAGADVLAIVCGKREKPDPKYFIGSGKAEEVHNFALLHKPDLIIFNHDLSPAQERNLEQLLECRVVDRTRLILDIFAQRARSFDGRLQVELAQLQYAASRLVGGWTHLERQKGGIGLRGPGETQLEEDRRVIKKKVVVLKQQLAKVQSRREASRKARHRSKTPIVSLVGYTNAGKSTLFNKLAASEIYTADQLFATLDPTLRKVEVKDFAEIILSDTVGFIRHLPPDLINAFVATLEEICAADLLLHVIDVTDDDWRGKVKIVNEILEQIGASKIPQLLVFNKIDLLTHLKPKVSCHPNGIPKNIRISATQNLGIDLLHQAIGKILWPEAKERRIKLAPIQGAERALLYQNHQVLSEKVDAKGNWHLVVRKLH